MFAKDMKRAMRGFISGIFAVIIRGPPSFGFFSSMKAGKNVIKMSARADAIKMVIVVRFGIICNLLSSIVYFPI